MSEFSNFLKLFSVGSSTNISSYLQSLPIKSNVVRRNNAPTFSIYGGTGSSIIKTPTNEIGDFISIVEECEQFRHLDFTENVILLLSTDIINLIDENRPICTVGNDRRDKIIANDLKYYDVRRRIRESIPDRIYYGSVSYLMKTTTINRRNKLFIYDLEHPYSLIQREVAGKKSYIIQGSTDIEIDERSIMYIGSADFKLKAPSVDFEVVKHESDQELQIKASEATYYASKPLFYSLIQKIKEYFIKDLLSTILSLRDAIQPIILTLNEEITRNGGDTSMFNNAATNLESLINRMSDSSITIAEILSIDTIVNAVFSSIRVLPDPGGTLQQLNSLNLDELKDKLNRLKDGIDDIKNGILDSLGIPSDLWNGSSNSNEVMQKNERLQTVVLNHLKSTKLATRHFVWSIINALHPDWHIREEDVIITLFRRSQAEYSRDQREISSLKDSLGLISETLANASEVIENNRFIDKDEYYEFLSKSMQNISEDIGRLILPRDKVKFNNPEDTDTSDNEDW